MCSLPLQGVHFNHTGQIKTLYLRASVLKKSNIPCTQAAGETPTLPEAAQRKYPEAAQRKHPEAALNIFVAFVKKAALLLSVSSFGEKRTLSLRVFVFKK